MQAKVLLRALLVTAMASATAFYGMAASADSVQSVSSVVLSVTATSGSNTGTWQLRSLDLPDPAASIITWASSGPINIMSGADVLATLDQVNVRIDSDPQVSLSFAATAGSADTLFTFNSAVVSFAPITNPAASATAAITLTDNTGDGASLTGQYAGNSASYSADTNLGNYAMLVPNTAVTSPFGSNTSLGSTSGAISGGVSSINSSFSFLLTKYDSASGTSNFSVVPEPGSLLALATGLAGMMGVAFRRRA